MSRSTLQDNAALSGNGGAVSVGTIATISIDHTVMKNNTAAGNGGALHLSSVAAATLRDIDASENKAGATGGAVAAFDSAYSKIALTNSTIHRNTGSSGGALSVKDSAMGIEGVQFIANSAQGEGGGAVAASGSETVLDIADTDCANVHILLDWATAGDDGCPVHPYTGTTCHAFMNYYDETCSTMMDLHSCNGCDCNDPCVSFFQHQLCNALMRC
jgi:predicted outer membrane repeat protein